MNEHAAPGRRAVEAVTTPSSLPVVTTAAAIFCVALVWLALQVRAGSDPAIGNGAASAAQQPRQIVVRRIIERRIVEEPAPVAQPVARSATTAGRPAPAAMVVSPAPAPAAPLPAPRSPAPPVAPMVTRAS